MHKTLQIFTHFFFEVWPGETELAMFFTHFEKSAILWSASKAVVSLFMEEDADSNGRKVAGPRCCTPWLRSPSLCLMSASAAKHQHVAHTLLVFQKTSGPRNSTYFTKYGERCHEVVLICQ